MESDAANQLTNPQNQLIEISQDSWQKCQNCSHFLLGRSKCLLLDKQHSKNSICAQFSDRAIELSGPRPDLVKKILIAGELLPASEYEQLSSIDDQTIRNAIEDWKQKAPIPYKNILESD